MINKNQCTYVLNECISTFLIVIFFSFAENVLSEKSVRILIAVLSARGHISQRQAIRQTWGKYTGSHHITLKFVVGVEKESSTCCNDCSQPDMLQVPAPESYHGLVDKLLHVLVWAVKEGSPDGFDYMMKADDDTYICVPELTRLLQKAPRLRHYRGQIWMGQAVDDVHHKNHLSPQDFPLSELPPYAYGGGYILSKDIFSFIYYNLHFLNAGIMRSGGNVEDVQVGLWMMGFGVKPFHDFRFTDVKFCHRKSVVLFNVCPHLMSILHEYGAGLSFTERIALFDRQGMCTQRVHQWNLASFQAEIRAKPSSFASFNQIGVRQVLLGNLKEATWTFEDVSIKTRNNLSLASFHKSSLTNLAAINQLVAENVSFETIYKKVDDSLQLYANNLEIPDWTVLMINMSRATNSINFVFNKKNVDFDYL